MVSVVVWLFLFFYVLIEGRSLVSTAYCVLLRRKVTKTKEAREAGASWVASTYSYSALLANIDCLIAQVSKNISICV